VLVFVLRAFSARRVAHAVMRVGMCVRDVVVVLVAVVVIGVPVRVGVLDPVRVLVGMLVLLGHGPRFGSRAAATLPPPGRRQITARPYGNGAW
jgi:hypothetical protein